MYIMLVIVLARAMEDNVDGSDMVESANIQWTVATSASGYNVSDLMTTAA